MAIEWRRMDRGDSWPQVEITNDDGLRLVIVSHGDSWTRSVSMPRADRARLWALALDRWVAPATGDSAYSPTGRMFWHEPRVIRRRHVVVIAQSGGLAV